MKTKNSHSKTPHLFLLAGDVRDFLLIDDQGYDGTKLADLVVSMGGPSPMRRAKGALVRWETKPFMDWHKTTDIYELYLEAKNAIEDEPLIETPEDTKPTLRQRVQKSKPTKSRRMNLLFYPAMAEKLKSVAKDLGISVNETIEEAVQMFFDAYDKENTEVK